MCTLTHRRLEDGFELYFNRDEKRARGPEQPPRIETFGEVKLVAPRDSDFGGSWIALNDRGCAVALLNGYRAADTESGEFTSRGSLVLEIARSMQLADALAKIEAFDLRSFRSFVLAVATPGNPLAIAEWDRARLEITRDGTSRVPLFSSSFQGTEVAKVRRAMFESAGSPRDDAGLRAFHRSHLPNAGPYSVCMHRDDAETRSFTQVSVGPREVSLAYSPAAPCREVPPMVVALPRRPGRA